MNQVYETKTIDSPHKETAIVNRMKSRCIYFNTPNDTYLFSSTYKRHKNMVNTGEYKTSS